MRHNLAFFSKELRPTISWSFTRVFQDGRKIPCFMSFFLLIHCLRRRILSFTKGSAAKFSQHCEQSLPDFFPEALEKNFEETGKKFLFVFDSRTILENGGPSSEKLRAAELRFFSGLDL